MTTEVYFIRAADGVGPIKIGVSGCPELRRRQLSSDLKTPLTILATAPGTFRDERRLHLRFAEYRVSGERFSTSPPVMEALEYVTRTGALPPVIESDRDVSIIQRYLSGDTLQEIGDDFGITRERVRQLLRKMNIPSLGYRDRHKNKAAPVTDFEREIAQAYAVDRTSPRELCEEYGIGQGRLYTILRRTGTHRLPRGRWLVRDDDAEITEKIVSMYRQGARGEDIAIAVGLGSSSNIYPYLRKAGVSVGARKTAKRVALADEIAERYARGETVKSLAGEYSMCRKTLAKLIAQRGLTRSHEEQEAIRLRRSALMRYSTRPTQERAA